MCVRVCNNRPFSILPILLSYCLVAIHKQWDLFPLPQRRRETPSPNTDLLYWIEGAEYNQYSTVCAQCVPHTNTWSISAWWESLFIKTYTTFSSFFFPLAPWREYMSFLVNPLHTSCRPFFVYLCAKKTTRPRPRPSWGTIVNNIVCGDDVSASSLLLPFLFRFLRLVNATRDRK